MSSNVSNTLPDPAPRSQNNRVSLDGGGGGGCGADASNNNNSGFIVASRKRKKQDELDGSSITIPDDVVASVSVPTIAAPPTNAHLTDEQKITLILTERLLSDNVKIVAEALDSLQMLVFSVTNNNFEENKKTAFRRGAHLAVVQAMRRHANFCKIQYNGMRVLSEISCCMLENFKHDIVAVGGLKACLEAMERHDNNTNVQVCGCLLIGNLYPNVRKTVVDEGGLKAVVKAMEENEENARVQQWGCCAFDTLLYQESSTWAKLAAPKRGSIDRVITAMNNHSNDADLQLEGCEFLSRLSKANDDYHKAILNAKGLVPVVEALRIHKNNAQVTLAARKANAAIILA